MSKTHPQYASGYQRQMVDWVRSGRTPGELARAFECSASAIRNWVRQADRDEGRHGDGLTTPEREEKLRGASGPSTRPLVAPTGRLGCMPSRWPRGAG